MVSAPDIPGHRVAGILGTGGFATVYRSWQLAVGREVAVKVDNRVLLSDRDRRRFLREVTAAGRLSGHPHVIDVYDAGTLGDGRPYLVMELCPAGSLNDSLHRHGPMSAAQVRDIGIRICDALAAAHTAGVLHRDIKPANILVNRYGMVGLSDFGLASIMAASGEQSATREALTPAYASPESFRCAEPTVAADLYSLAATLYALLAGRPPRFPADASSPGLAAIIMLHDEPVEDVPGVPPELMALLRWCLATDPAARPASAVAMRDALVALAARPAGPPARSASAAGPPISGVATAGPPSRAAASGPRSQDAWPGEARREGRSVSGPPGISAGGTPAEGRSAGGTPEGGRSAGGISAGGTPAGGRSVERASAGGSPAEGGSVERASAGGAHAAVSARGRRPMARYLVVAACVAVVVAAAAIIGARLLPRGGKAEGPAAAPGVFGIPTVTSGCPAASVRRAGARCTQAPECWAGLVVTAGSATARSLPCTRPHIWETFAIAILPADARTYGQTIVAANPAVRAVCSMPVLLRSRRGRANQIPPGSWAIDVLPPDEAAFSSGARAYRCVAHVLTGPDPSTSAFGR